MESLFLWTLSGVLAYYFLQTLTLVYGLFRLPKRRAWSELPRVTVVVAARNEEKNIGRTLASLVELDYPRDKLEIIVSDGASTDNTCAVVESFAANYDIVKLHRADQSRSIRGKANAIHQAIERSSGEFIMMTDADCAVQPSWIRQTLEHFTDEVGLVCGITIPVPKNAFAAMQLLDWVYILATSSGRASIGQPIGGIGNNFNFRRQTYDDVGGYAAIKFSVTEDFALFQAILKSRWKIAFPILYETHNQTEPMPTVSELYAQKKRWTLGALDASFTQGILAAEMFLAHLLPLVAFAVLPFTTALAALAVKFLADAMLILPALSRLRQLKTLYAFPLFEVYYYLFVFAVPIILSFSREIIWKDISYHRSDMRSKTSTMPNAVK